jgi:hypothetical protein
MKRLHIDVPSVTPDEACELVIHHLRLAAAYFEATPHDQCVQLLQEAHRQRAVELASPWWASPWWAPAVDFIKGLQIEYEHVEGGRE